MKADYDAKAAVFSKFRLPIGIVQCYASTVTVIVVVLVFITGKFALGRESVTINCQVPASALTVSFNVNVQVETVLEAVHDLNTFL